jgi:hypothetical protein
VVSLPVRPRPLPLLPQRTGTFCPRLPASGSMPRASPPLRPQDGSQWLVGRRPSQRSAEHDRARHKGDEIANERT